MGMITRTTLSNMKYRKQYLEQRITDLKNTIPFLQLNISGSIESTRAQWQNTLDTNIRHLKKFESEHAKLSRDITEIEKMEEY